MVEYHFAIFLLICWFTSKVSHWCKFSDNGFYITTFQQLHNSFVKPDLHLQYKNIYTLNSNILIYVKLNAHHLSTWKNCLFSSRDVSQDDFFFSQSLDSNYFNIMPCLCHNRILWSVKFDEQRQIDKSKFRYYYQRKKNAFEFGSCYQGKNLLYNEFFFFLRKIISQGTQKTSQTAASFCLLIGIFEL